MGMRDRPGGSDNDSEGNTTSPRYLRSQSSRPNNRENNAVKIEGVYRQGILPDSSATVANVLGPRFSFAPLALVLRNPDGFDEILVSTCNVNICTLHIPHIRN